MPKIERTVTVATPLERVWAFLTDFTTTEQWDPPTVSTTRISGDGSVGTVYRNVSTFLGHEAETEYTVVTLDPMREFHLEGTATGMKLLDTMRFERAGEGTTVTYTSEFMPQGAAKLASPLLAPALKKVGDDAAARMDEVLSAL
jgi:carbon monoxide dehydrogenase subunit G